MKKVLKILAVILVGLFTCACLGLGGFYTVAIKTEKTQKSMEEMLTATKETLTEDAALTNEDLPNDAGEIKDTDVITLTLGEIVTNSIGLDVVRDYLGVELFRSILICLSVCGAFVEGILVSTLFRKKVNRKTKTSITQITNLPTESQALEGYRVLKNGNGLKF